MFTLFAAGSNAKGQLGNGTIDDSHMFQPCSFSQPISERLPESTRNVLAIATGSNHTLALLKVESSSLERESKEVWGCGDGSKGQLGMGYPKRMEEQSTPVFQRLPLEEILERFNMPEYTVQSIAATWETSYIVLTCPQNHDVILSFGSNEFGDLGTGEKIDDKRDELHMGFHIVDFSHIVLDRGSIHVAKEFSVQWVRTGQRQVIVSIRVNRGENGDDTQLLVGWGSARHGQLDNLAEPIPQAKLKAGRKISSKATYHSRPTLIFCTDIQSEYVTECALGIHHCVFLHASGRISYRGSNRKDQTNGLEFLGNINDIKCTWNGTYALTTNPYPHILSNGSNSHGQLGRKEQNTQLFHPVDLPPETFPFVNKLACGSEHTLACLSDHDGRKEVWGWGWNEHGNLGIGHTDDVSVPTKIWPPIQGNADAAFEPVLNVWGGAGSTWILCGPSAPGTKS